MWQGDFSPRPVRLGGETLWELLLCDARGQVMMVAQVPQSQATESWLTAQLQALALPEAIAVFRPDCLPLFSMAGAALGVNIVPQRQVPALKRLLRSQWQQYGAAAQSCDPGKLLQNPPQPLPEHLWGEAWQFVTIAAADLWSQFHDRPIPYRHLPEELNPLGLGLASTTAIPGVAITGGRRSRAIAQWLSEQQPAALNYVITQVGQAGGLLLESGLIDRWLIATLEDGEIAQRGQRFQQEKSQSQGLHFVLIQPDQSGLTYSGLWLLQDETDTPDSP